MSLKKEQLCTMNLHYQHYTVDYFLDSTVRNGFSKFELWAASPHFFVEDGTPGRIAALKKKIRERGLEMVCFTPETVVYPYNMAELDPQIRERSVRYLLRSVECAAEFACRKMLLTPGWGNLDEDRDEAMKWSLDSMGRILRRAAELNVTLALEHLSPISSNLINTAKQLRQALDHFNSPHLKAMFDTCQVCLAGEHVREYFETLGRDIVHVHIVDGTPGGHLAFGDGNIPLREFVETMGDCGYEGMLSMEIADRRYFARPDEADARSAKQFHQWIGQ